LPGATGDEVRAGFAVSGRMFRVLRVVQSRAGEQMRQVAKRLFSAEAAGKLASGGLRLNREAQLQTFGKLMSAL